MMDLSIPFAVQNEDGQKKQIQCIVELRPETRTRTINTYIKEARNKRRHRCVTDK